ncbi:MAG: hypothetical protein GY731_18220 [Gammaproteobacteria bacterium]|nr:hypothetical protein [Gammaproteobacteria bacterium]
MHNHFNVSKIGKQIKKVKKCVQQDNKHMVERLECIKVALSKLKAAQKDMRVQLENERDKRQIRRLEESVDVIRMHRKKGLMILREVQASLR